MSAAAAAGTFSDWLQIEQQKHLLKICILSLAAIVSFVLRLFAVIRYESVIHEFGIFCSLIQ